jgi:exopolysaccharide biosynthesis protein
VKDFQQKYNLSVDGKIGSQTKGKAQEVKELIDYILNYQKPSTPSQSPTFTHYKKDGADVFEIDPLTISHIWLQGSKSQPASVLAKQYPNFVNAMFFDSGSRAVFRLIIEDGKILSPIKSYDQYPDKGTFIIYKSGHCEVKTIGRKNLSTLDLSNIKLAIQGFNMDYEANGSTNLRDSLRKEGWATFKDGQWDDYIYGLVNNRPAIGYDPAKKKVIIAIKNTDSSGIRTFMRSLGCKMNGNTCSLGLDSGGSTALVKDSKVIYGTNRNLVSILVF